MHRRHGNIMVFVVLLLAALFISTLGFLSLMRVNREVLLKNRQDALIEQLIQEIIDTTMGLSTDASAGIAFDYDPTNLCTPAANPMRVPYAQLYFDCDGDGLVDTPDGLVQYAEIPGVSHLVSSLDPDLPFVGAPRIEYFGTTDLYRALDDRSDVFGFGLAPNVEINPRLPVTHPLRVRMSDETLTVITDTEDLVIETQEAHFYGRDASGDGVVDAMTVSLATLGGTLGELDSYPTFIVGGADGQTLADSVDCANGNIDWTLFPNFTGTPARTGGGRTPLPCDDEDNSGVLEEGDLYPSSIRNWVAADLRDPAFSTDDNVYLAMRLEQNSGKVNINHSHWSLIDNLFGLDSGGALLSATMNGRPYSTSVHEPLLRRRGVLPDQTYSDTFPLGSDLAMSNDLRSMLRMHMTESLSGNTLLQWLPIPDEPGEAGVFDLDWSLWMDPRQWMDTQATAGAPVEFDIRHMLTTASYDDLMLRNGFYRPLSQPSSIPTTGVLLTDLISDPVAGVNPQYPMEYVSTAVLPAVTLPADGTGYVSTNQSAIEMYPGYDPNYAGGGDTSFTDGVSVRKVPLMLSTDSFGDSSNIYGPPRDSVTGKTIDLQFGKMKFALHSIGNIDAPTQREVQTVLDYFTAMLRNIWDMNGDTFYGFADDDAIHDQAAQLTANFIDFADTNRLPTGIQSRSSTVPPRLYYGVEREPYISEVFVAGAAAGSDWGVELIYPHDDAVADLDLGAVGFEYAISINDGAELQPFTAGETIGPGSNTLVSVTNNTASMPVPALVNPLADLTLMTVGVDPTADRIQLVRTIDAGATWIVIDEVDLTTMTIMPGSLRRDNINDGGWRAVVPDYENLGTHDLGSPNAGTTRAVAPVHATTADLGLEGSYPTTGSMLLLMRYANELLGPGPPIGRPMTTKITDFTDIDNGHMPVFDPRGVYTAQQDWATAATSLTGGQPLDGSTLLSLPWGQLVFDYFTALPLTGNTFDATAALPAFWPPDDSTNFPSYLRSNQPQVEWNGMRVHGRININAAAWKVIEGLPLMPPGALPIYYKDGLLVGVAGTPGSWFALPNPTGAGVPPMQTESVYFSGIEVLGREKAMGIVAYRELREIDTTGFDLLRAPNTTTGNYSVLPYAGALPDAALRRSRSDMGAFTGGPVNTLADTTQRHTAGFLTVGELANVRNPGTYAGSFAYDVDPGYQMDNGYIMEFYDTNTIGNYLAAVAPLVAISDWVTVKNNAFTMYGTLRGAGDKTIVDDKAFRFEHAYDRTNVLVTEDTSQLPTTIYQTIETYLP